MSKHCYCACRSLDGKSEGGVSGSEDQRRASETVSETGRQHQHHHQQQNQQGASLMTSWEDVSVTDDTNRDVSSASDLPDDLSFSNDQGGESTGKVTNNHPSFRVIAFENLNNS